MTCPWSSGVVVRLPGRKVGDEAAAVDVNVRSVVQLDGLLQHGFGNRALLMEEPVALLGLPIGKSPLMLATLSQSLLVSVQDEGSLPASALSAPGLAIATVMG